MAGFLLHSAAVAYVWNTWELGQRGLVLAWMDFPLSLLYADLGGRALLATVVVAGGLWWALLAAAASYGVGRLAAGRRAVRG
jgi:hypothetical protein